MISFRKLAKLISPEPWDDFLLRMNEEKAQEALEDLVNNEGAMERMAGELTSEEELQEDLMEIANEGK